MSIRDEINKHVISGELHHLLPLLEGSRVVRTLFISREVSEIADPFAQQDNWDGLRLQKVRPMLDAFINGRRISVAPKPRNKDTTAFIARVEPVQHEVWDIRVIDPNPGVRIFGRFSEFNTFIAINWDFRENLETDEEWKQQIDDCLEQWRKLFSKEPIYSNAKVSDYVEEPFFIV